MDVSQSPPVEDTFKILVTTDNHLGYGEEKPIIDRDSFRTFEECLQIGVKSDVDMILLGGDLFHDATPSSNCIYRCTELLRKYCLGDKAVAIEFLSDQSENFKHLKNPIVNYEDPNLNVSIPVFSIHGNHDNPTGTAQVSALDILASSGLVNYFGKWDSLTEVEIKPILLRKGETKIALYGLSHIPDRRLARLFAERKVSMPRPEEDDWFYILVLHQNRADRGQKNFIPYTAIPDFFHLVIWGHEHDCEITPMQRKNDSDVYISQPGSTVATSLSHGEAQQKKVGILQVYKTKFNMIEKVLQTVRPFIFSDLTLRHPNSEAYDLVDPQAQAKNDAKIKIEEMLADAKAIQEALGSPPMIPFIRLVVAYYTESQTFNCNRMGHEYEDQVANPADMFKMVEKTQQRKKHLHSATEEENQFPDMDDNWASRIEDVIEKYFENNQRETSMSVFSVKMLTSALRRYIDSVDKHAMINAIDLQMRDALEKLILKDPDEKDTDECLAGIKEQNLSNEDQDLPEFLKKLSNTTIPQKDAEPSVSGIISIDGDDDDVEEVPPPKRGRGSRVSARAGRSSTARTTKRTRGRAT